MARQRPSSPMVGIRLQDYGVKIGAPPPSEFRGEAAFVLKKWRLRRLKLRTPAARRPYVFSQRVLPHHGALEILQALSLRYKCERPIFPIGNQPSTDGILQHIVQFLHKAFVISQPVFKKIPLPLDPELMRYPMLPVPNAFCDQSLFRKAQNKMHMIWHAVAAWTRHSPLFTRWTTESNSPRAVSEREKGWCERSFAQQVIKNTARLVSTHRGVSCGKDRRPMSILARPRDRRFAWKKKNGESPFL